MEEINEIKIKEAFDPVSIEKSKIIISQMENCVCKIHLGRKKGTGFFAKIPYKNDLLNVLITNNHVLNEEKIAIGNVITISLNNEKITINIEIDETMKRYTNENYDITIIELKENDKINNFLDMSDQIKSRIDANINENFDYFNNLYEKESIYILNYMTNIYVSYGLLNGIKDGKISHKCSTDEGSSGSPILLLETNKVIGVHYSGSNNNYNSNFGTLLVQPLIEFQKIANNLLIIKKEKENNNSNINSFNNSSTLYSNQISSKFNNININLLQRENNKEQNEINHININESISLNLNSNESHITFKNSDNNSQEKSNEIQNLIFSGTFNNSNEDNIYHKCMFKHLIRFAILKKELLSETNLFQKNLTQAYLINKKIINKLIQLYNLDYLISNLDNEAFDMINYKNFDNNYNKILGLLEEYEINHDNIIQQNEIKGDIQFNENEYSLTTKSINEPKKLKYFDDFEIIDENFMKFIIKKYTEIEILPVQLGSIKNNNIFLIINKEDKYIYEIMSFNSTNDLNFKYLLVVEKNKVFEFEKSLNQYIFGVLVKNELSKLINKGIPIKLENNNLTFNFYSNNIGRNKNKKLNHKGSLPDLFSKNLGKKYSLINNVETIPDNKNGFLKEIKIVFQINNELKVEIYIDYSKKIKDLILLFFKKIKQINLYKDKEIYFYHNNKILAHDSKETLKSIFKYEKGSKIILVNDLAKKIKL